MELQGKRVAILVEDNYEDLELWYPTLRLLEAGAHVTVHPLHHRPGSGLSSIPGPSILRQ